MLYNGVAAYRLTNFLDKQMIGLFAWSICVIFVKGWHFFFSLKSMIYNGVAYLKKLILSFDESDDQMMNCFTIFVLFLSKCALLQI